MITAVDTNVLLDILNADPEHGPASRAALRQCQQEGRLIACDIVWAELGAWFSRQEQFEGTLTKLRVHFSTVNQDAAWLAGRRWFNYRRRGGRRQRVIADYLIGAHAQLQADRLLSRDRGFYRNDFSELSILNPSSA